MKWIKVTIDTPNIETFGNKKILVLVNKEVFLCTVMKEDHVYIVDDNFLYSKRDGWCGDPRFGKPTHWMPLPTLPFEEK